jgi:hypothetical protein
MPSKEQPDIDDDVLEEGCYHLLKLGLTSEQIAQHFEITPPRVKQLASSHAAKLASGAVVGDPFDAVFWQDVKKEAEGDTKVTFISEKGVHHAWKSDLGKLNGPSLLAIFEATRIS